MLREASYVRRGGGGVATANHGAGQDDHEKMRCMGLRFHRNRSLPAAAAHWAAGASPSKLVLIQTNSLSISGF